MIALTRMNGTEIWLNPDQILSVESTPDTVVTLMNHEKLLVNESPETIQAAFLAYKKKIMSPTT